MALDIRGSLKNTRISKNPFVVFEELLSNAIDSYLILQHQDPQHRNFSTKFSIQFLPDDLLGEQPYLVVTCEDFGCGMGDQQLDAFVTKDTSYKDDLAIDGIGQCKGAGRIQFFHHFNVVEIDTRFRNTDEEYRQRTFRYVGGEKLIGRDSFKNIQYDGTDVGTKFTLESLTDKAKEVLVQHGQLKELFSAKSLKQHLIVAFLQRLVGLASQLGDFRIEIETSDQLKRDQEPIRENETLLKADLPIVDRVVPCEVQEQDPSDGSPLPYYQNISVSHYKLDSEIYKLKKNSIALCAKSSPVKDISHHFLKSKSVLNNPISGYYHIILLESVILDKTVNEQRDDFGLPDEIPNDSFLYSGSTISLQAIYEALYPVIADMIDLPTWDKEEVIEAMVMQYGVSEDMISDTGARVRHGDTAKDVTERVLKKYQDRIIESTAAIIDLKNEIKNCEPDSEEFRKKVNEIAWKYTSTLTDIDKANLSQLVVRRAAIVEILSLACNKKLNMQIASTLERQKNERIIHSIFFPMQKDSIETSDHDIWLLSEEYSYFKYIASDKSLGSIKWEDGSNLFEPGIDDQLAALMIKTTNDNVRKRPDIALFGEEGSAIIIEFKAPGVSMDDHTGDLMEYAQLLAAKSGGRLKKFYGYLIGTEVNPNRLRGYKRFPTGRGYFGTETIIEHQTQRPLGELYSEVIFYDDVVTRAEQRLRVYKQKLSFSLN